jgi:hypothetical protein
MGIVFDLMGVGGSLLVIVAYFSTQQGWLDVNDWRFPTANLIGSVMILISLYGAWNLGAGVMEVFWLLISLYGLWRLKKR